MSSGYQEQALAFECETQTLIAVTGCPAVRSSCGVLIVVGGPQYRAGSHRQFVLLARYLGSHGIASMRFDYRGMGDSEGHVRNFESVQADIRAAIDAFLKSCEGLERVVIWGLCDAASAAVMYAYQDSRVCGLVMLNPWVRTAQSEAKAYIRHYYLRRLIDTEWWIKVARGDFEFGKSFASLVRVVKKTAGSAPHASPNGVRPLAALPDRMADGLARFKGEVLLILSGNDLTAQEFVDVTRASQTWRRLLAGHRITHQTLEEANHTFSTRVWRDRVAAWTTEWLIQHFKK
jgi:exosortase A-associated hydrolase 1